MDNPERVATRASRRIAVAVFAVAAVAVAFGIFARIDALDHKLFWQDEAYSMLRITGHTQTELDREFDGRVHPASDLLALVRVDPRRGVAATVASLREEPQRGPLFYLVARAWAGAFGDGIVPMRALSACIGIGAIAFAFLLGRRAGGAACGAVLAALVAIAPLDVRFSQQVREYEAIVAVALASAWLLLRICDRPSPARAAWYGVSALAGLLVSPIFAAVVAGHAVVAAIAARRDGAARFGAWAAAVALASLASLAWYAGTIATAGAHADDLGWLRTAYPLRSFALKWAFNAGTAFFDAEFAHPRAGPALVPILALVAFACVSACAWPRDAAIRGLALATVLCCALPLVVLDVATRAHFESVTRYQMTTWTGLTLVVALLLARGLAAEGRAARAALAAFALLVACGAYSAFAARPYAVWWDDNEHLDERAVAARIAAGGAPALVLASKAGAAEPYALVLARYVAPATGLLLFDEHPPGLPPAAGHTYLFVPAPAVLDTIVRRVAPARRVRNASPSIGLTIPDLRGAREAQAGATLQADNALWEIVPLASPAAR